MNIFDTLTELPLFKGVSRETMSRTVGNYRFEFKKYAPGEIIVKAGAPCRSVIFILSGKVNSSLSLSDDLRIVQILPANVMIDTEFLFGKHTSHPALISAEDRVAVLEISKNDFIGIIASDTVFMFNYLNILSRKSQKIFDNYPVTGSLLSQLTTITDFFTDPKATQITVCFHPDTERAFGMSPEQFSSEARKLLEKKLIANFDGMAVYISDRSRLLEAGHCINDNR